MIELKSFITRPVTFIHTDTGNQTTSAILTLAKIDQAVQAHYSGKSKKYQWEYTALAAKAYLEEKPFYYIKKSFLNIPKALELLDKGKYSKKVFPCCYYIKHKPFELWLRKDDHSKDVVISSIRPGESHQRQIFLGTLRKQKTYFNYHRRFKIMYYYPLRDMKGIDVHRALQPGQLFWNTEKSGCRVCPILALFNLTNEGERYIRTMRVLDNILEKYPFIKKIKKLKRS
jgi:3'-phosphoadenosine 5'-phosphosulfate sulfotransferase (PAPS reductase)/FAD synthetase